MSTDTKVTKHVMQTLADGREGYTKGAEKLTETSAPTLATTFHKYSAQRATFYGELDSMAGAYGDDVEESGSVAAAVHRGWMTVKDAVSGSDPEGVLEVAEQGEDHALKVYGDALDEDISAVLRTVLERQHRAVQAAHDEIRDLRDTFAKKG